MLETDYLLIRSDDYHELEIHYRVADGADIIRILDAKSGDEFQVTKKEEQAIWEYLTYEIIPFLEPQERRHA